MSGRGSAIVPAGRARGARSALLAACACAAALAACDTCGGDRQAALATLTAMHGEEVHRDFAAQRERWQPAELRARFQLGDGLQTRARSTALLALVDGSKLEVDADTTIRFLAGGEGGGEQGIDVLAGEAVLLAGARDLNLHTHVGRAVLRAGSRVRLTRTREALDLNVEVGEARFRDSQARDVRIGQGEDVRLLVGMAVLRDRNEPAPAEAPATADAGVASGAAAPAAELATDSGRGERLPEGGTGGPDYANFAVRAGESFVVHAPQVPVAIAFEIAHACAGDGVLEVNGGKQRARGRGVVRVLLSAGARKYVLRCQDRGRARVVARGTAQVLHDAGTRKLPPRAPTSEVDADGRSYTIYYQNQPPEVRARWPNPPRAGAYALDVDGEVITLKAAEHVFRSGSLRDGTHRLTFEAQGRKSRTATVTVRFDNAAPTASLIAPSDRGFAPGETVALEGVTLPGWKVSVRSGTIKKDGEDRFEGRVVTSVQYPDVAVRLSHPRRGTHYYLRRARGSR